MKCCFSLLNMMIAYFFKSYEGKYLLGFDSQNRTFKDIIFENLGWTFFTVFAFFFDLTTNQFKMK